MKIIKILIKIAILMEYISFIALMIYSILLDISGKLHPYAFIVGYALFIFLAILIFLGLLLLIGKFKYKHSEKISKRYIILIPPLILLIYANRDLLS